jgi:hypothetical protein
MLAVGVCGMGRKKSFLRGKRGRRSEEKNGEGAEVSCWTFGSFNAPP